MDKSGVDGDGNVYATPKEFWRQIAASKSAQGGSEGGAGVNYDAAASAASAADEAANSSTSSLSWYTDAVQYWDQQEASDNGVLGGFGHISPQDVTDSRAFLKKAFKGPLQEAAEGRRQLVALDCGAGVGRVSEQLLLHHFQEVDLVEPSAHLLDKARQRLTGPGSKPFPTAHKAVNFFQQGLEDFDPEPQRYDVIWVQWAMLYLTDDDALAFLRRCIAALRPGGMVFVKENVCEEGFIVDKDDASVTRSHAYYVELLQQAGLLLMHTALQKGFPKGLFKVRMYALKPKS